MTIGDEHRVLVADFLLDLVLDRTITAAQAQRLHPTMNGPGASAKAARELARFDRQVLQIDAVPRRRRWRLTPGLRRTRTLSPAERYTRWMMESAEASDEQDCNCFSTWYCVVHNTGWLA